MIGRRRPRPTRLLAALPGAPSFVSGSLHGPEEGDLAMLIGLAAIGVAALAITIVVLGARRLASRGTQVPEPTDRGRQRLPRDEEIDPIVAALGVGDERSARRRRRPPPFDEDRPPSWPAT